MAYDVNRDDLDAHEPSLTSPSRRFPLLTLVALFVRGDG